VRDRFNGQKAMVEIEEEDRREGGNGESKKEKKIDRDREWN
jgi:hypothetical protein